MRKYEEMGMELINKLGFENKPVIDYWTAYEKDDFEKMEKIFKKWLDK